MISPEDFNLKLESYTITRVTNTKFLGVTIDEKLNWSHHIDELKISLRKFVGIFYKLSYYTPQNILKMLYYSMVHSKITYGIEVYANTYQTFLHDLIILNNRILRITQKKNRRTHVEELYFSYKTLPIDKLFNYRLLLHAHAIINKSNNIPPFFHKTFILNNQIHTHNTRSHQDIHRTSFNSVFGRKTTPNLCSQLWNALPQEIKEIGQESGFKRSLKNLFLMQLASSSS